MQNTTIVKNNWGYVNNVNRSLKTLETTDVSEAYSSLKVLYLELKLKCKRQHKEINALNEELDDYKVRYDEIIRLYNALP